MQFWISDKPEQKEHYIAKVFYALNHMQLVILLGSNNIDEVYLNPDWFFLIAQFTANRGTLFCASKMTSEEVPEEENTGKAIHKIDIYTHETMFYTNIYLKYQRCSPKRVFKSQSSCPLNPPKQNPVDLSSWALTYKTHCFVLFFSSRK